MHCYLIYRYHEILTPSYYCIQQSLIFTSFSYFQRFFYSLVKGIIMFLGWLVSQNNIEKIVLSF